MDIPLIAGTVSTVAFAVSNLPMLRKARDVTIAAIPERDDDRSAVLAGVTDVAAWLDR